jgi:hypothetical protein
MGSGAAIVRNTRHPPLLNRCPKQQMDLAIPIIPASFALSALDDANSAVTQNYRQNSGVLVILESICRAYIIGVICVARRAQVAMAT